MLHPRYKSIYFVKAKWPSDWIVMAEALLREQWTKSYQQATLSAAPTVVGGFSHVYISYLQVCTQAETSSKNKYFVELNSFSTDMIILSDPISDWLSTPPLPNVTDPIV